MYKIMIVDDEPIEREAFELIIKNNMNNMELVGKAENGFEAIEMCEQVKPDIVVMDIKMPGISGLDAIKEIKNILPYVKFLILSSYNQFDYAQRALKLGVEDFIVKPAKKDRLISAINTIVDKLKNEHQKRQVDTILQNKVESIKPVVENDTVYSIISGCSEDELKHLLTFLELNLDQGFCLAVVGRNNSEAMVLKIKQVLFEIGISCIGALINNRMIFFIPSSHNDQESFAKEIANYVKSILDRSNIRKLVIGSGKVYSGSNGLKRSYIDAIEALRTAMLLKIDYIHINTIDLPKGIQSINIGYWSKTIFDNICAGDVNKTIKIVDAFLEELSVLYDGNQTSVKDKVYQVMVLLDKSLSEIIGNEKISYELTSILQEINDLTDIKGLQLWMIKRIQRLVEKINKKRNTTNSRAIVIDAIDYINKHYDENISLEDVAEKLTISPYYLSKILKKHTSKNYTDIVAQTRINKAKKLLADSNYSIKEVTYRTGFNSQNYFSKIFRKLVGVTPTEYKNMIHESNSEE